MKPAGLYQYDHDRVRINAQLKTCQTRIENKKNGNLVLHLGYGTQQKALARGGGVMLVVECWKRIEYGAEHVKTTERPNVGKVTTNDR